MFINNIGDFGTFIVLQQFMLQKIAILPKVYV
jgi:hypothetical protein